MLACRSMVNWSLIFRLLHHLGSAGVLGAFAAIIIVVTYAPSPEISLVGYASARTSSAMISKWILVPALLLVICSGLLSMAATPVKVVSESARMAAMLNDTFKVKSFSYVNYLIPIKRSHANACVRALLYEKSSQKN